MDCPLQPHSGALNRALAPMARAQSVPLVLHADPAIFASEREALFLKQWFFLCCGEQLPKVGECRTSDTPSGPIILVQGQGNCGARIMRSCNACSYFSDGRLNGCPDMADVEGVDRREIGPVPLALQEWGWKLTAVSRMPRSGSPVSPKTAASENIGGRLWVTMT